LNVRADALEKKMLRRQITSMRFALFNNQRIEATPKAYGICPSCKSEMLARCGSKKVWHWAHKGRRHCDHWWENETEWHRNWKNLFPTDWQEVPARDGTGELHIADIKTPDGLVVEFQHSAIKLDEVKKRTIFYDKIIWIIDGNRRPTDRAQYERMLSENRPQRFDGVDIYTVYAQETRLLTEWGALGRFIGFDFGGDRLCLLTAAQGNSRYIFDFSKEKFAQSVIAGEPLPRVLFGKPTQRGRRRRY
jgi:competence protein CoiA